MNINQELIVQKFASIQNAIYKFVSKTEKN